MNRRSSANFDTRTLILNFQFDRRGSTKWGAQIKKSPLSAGLGKYYHSMCTWDAHLQRKTAGGGVKYVLTHQYFRCYRSTVPISPTALRRRKQGVTNVG